MSLPLPPAVTNRAEAEAAVAALLELDRRSAERSAAIRQAAEAVDLRHSLSAPLDAGETLTNAEARLRLTDRLVAFANEDPEGLFADGNRQLDCPAGMLVVRRSAPRLDDVDGERTTTAEAVCGTVRKRGGVLALLVAALADRTFGGVDLSRLCRVKVEPDRPGILKAAKAGELSAASLKRLNLSLNSSPPPTIEVKPR